MDSPHSRTYSEDYLTETGAILHRLDRAAIEGLVLGLEAVRRRGGRMFVLGVGGSAANASHVVSDLRKLCGIEAYAATDNIAELTARTNDEGWAGTFRDWLIGSRLHALDGLLILSVGGGSPLVSENILRAIDLAVEQTCWIAGITGPDGGATFHHAHVCLRVPADNPLTRTAHAEAFQAVIWHLLVNHPRLRCA